MIEDVTGFSRRCLSVKLLISLCRNHYVQRTFYNFAIKIYIISLESWCCSFLLVKNVALTALLCIWPLVSLCVVVLSEQSPRVWVTMRWETASLSTCGDVWFNGRPPVDVSIPVDWSLVMYIVHVSFSCYIVYCMLRWLLWRWKPVSLVSLVAMATKACFPGCYDD